MGKEVLALCHRLSCTSEIPLPREWFNMSVPVLQMLKADAACYADPDLIAGAMHVRAEELHKRISHAALCPFWHESCCFAVSSA
jgi:hypothetical protein